MANDSVCCLSVEISPIKHEDKRLTSCRIEPCLAGRPFTQVHDSVDQDSSLSCTSLAFSIGTIELFYNPKENNVPPTEPIR